MGRKPLNSISSPTPPSVGSLSIVATLLSAGHDVSGLRARPGNYKLRIIASEFRLANKFHQSVAYGVELAEEQFRRNPVLIGGSINVDDNDLAAFPQRGPQPPQECIGLAHLMVHVDHEHPIEAIFGQAWIVFRPKLDRHVVQSLVLDAAAEPPQRVLINVLG